MTPLIQTVLTILAVVLGLVVAWRIGVWQGRAEIVYDLIDAWLEDKDEAILTLDKFVEVEKDG